MPTTLLDDLNTAIAQFSTSARAEIGKALLRPSKGRKLAWGRERAVCEEISNALNNLGYKSEPEREGKDLRVICPMKARLEFKVLFDWDFLKPIFTRTVAKMLSEDADRCLAGRAGEDERQVQVVVVANIVGNTTDVGKTKFARKEWARTRCKVSNAELHFGNLEAFCKCKGGSDFRDFTAQRWMNLASLNEHDDGVVFQRPVEVSIRAFAWAFT